MGPATILISTPAAGVASPRSGDAPAAGCAAPCAFAAARDITERVLLVRRAIGA